MQAAVLSKRQINDRNSRARTFSAPLKGSALSIREQGWKDQLDQFKATNTIEMNTTFSTQIVRRILWRFAAQSAVVLVAVASLTSKAAADQVKSFCEYASATALQLTAGGAVWSQQWGLPSWSWYDCQASPNIGFLNEYVTGRQETVTSGTPVVDPNLLLFLPFQGTLTLTAYDEDNPEQVSGRIAGAMSGTFVADLNAAHATITDSTITIAFGQSVHSGPDALIQVTQTTGTFQSLHASGDWDWRVSGTVTIARVATLDPQTNLLGALRNSALLLGASEEVVLSGQYTRSQPAGAQ